ncbi:oxoglutarate-dependent flavonoid 7-O-demethylase 1 isoform X2 [Cryptomeria japonica]|uniref:oxoglutarate-dependent flavonoid 7-O-demethylase 1 isoform X2 n=1 Tax=Cryptomeria japonica TaxID=3369 RepID=UPI0027DA1A54|nr:oxoglutarate-dependent flavonoid 7-O-demethylase 1 isoform X2 [Cryptomeria japonica]
MDALLKQLERLQRPIDMVQTFHDCQIREVPARYILPFDQRPSLALEAPQSIPVIDLAAHRSEIITQVAQAAQDWGFFQIINHGIDLALLERVKGVSQEFFDLPLEEKRRQCPVRPGTHLLEGYGRFYDISDDTVLDWVDALVHFISPSSVKAVEHWPKRPLTYRKTYEKYGEEVLNLTDKLLGFLSEGLGLDSDYVQTLIKEPLLQLRTNYYPPCPQPDLVNGLRPHSDGDVLTILLDDQVVGLQVRKGVEWFNVSPVPGSLVVNVGDFLEIISNGKYKSAEHRAVANTNQYRMSIVMFLSPQDDVRIAPAPELIDETHPRLYHSTVSHEYGTSYVSKDVRGKAPLQALLIEQES